MSDMTAAEVVPANAANGTQSPEQKPTEVVPPGCKRFVFFFKKKDIKDDQDNVVAKDFKHPDVSGIFPVPSKDELIAALGDTESPKVGDMILETVQDLVFLAARGQINAWLEENPGKVFTTTLFDVSKLTLAAIAAMPKGQRGAWAPGEDDMKSFVEDYAEVLVNKLKYDPKKTAVHVKHFKNGLTAVKTNKPVIAKLQEFLTAWASQTEAMEDNEATYAWLTARAKKYLEAEEKNLLDAL